MNHDLHGHGTRSNININDNTPVNNSLFIPYARTTNYGLKQMKVSGPKIWNNLPNNIKNQISLIVFSRNIKSHFISSYG